jgi:hypothetical protein
MKFKIVTIIALLALIPVDSLSFSKKGKQPDQPYVPQQGGYVPPVTVTPPPLPPRRPATSNLDVRNIQKLSREVYALRTQILDTVKDLKSKNEIDEVSENSILSAVSDEVKV